MSDSADAVRAALGVAWSGAEALDSVRGKEQRQAVVFARGQHVLGADESSRSVADLCAGQHTGPRVLPGARVDVCPNGSGWVLAR